MATTQQPTGRLPDLMLQAIAALSADASPESLKRLKERLQPFAAELMLEWLTGEKRFESQSQQVEYWLITSSTSQSMRRHRRRVSGP